MSSDINKPIVYEGIKYIRIKARGCHDTSGKPCAFYDFECSSIVNDCTGIILQLDPDPLNLINHRLLK